jgi:ribosomal protein S18 acetylase RimI-like enzyme
MERAFIRPAVAADAAAVTEIVVALESLYGPSTFSQADLEEEWSDVDLGRDAVVVDDGRRILGYGILREHDDVSRAEGYVHPDAVRRGIGTMIATGLERDAARRGARRFHNAVLEADAGAPRPARVARVRRRAGVPRDAHRAGRAAARPRMARRPARHPLRSGP